MRPRQVPPEMKGSYQRTFVGAFRVDPELWSSFKGTCKMRGVSICHVLEALIAAWIQGQKATATVIKPVTVNLHMEHIVQRPRRKLPHPGPSGFESHDIKEMLAACWRLKIKTKIPGRVGWCPWASKMLAPGECYGCAHQGEF